MTDKTETTKNSEAGQNYNLVISNGAAEPIECTFLDNTYGVIEGGTRKFENVPEGTVITFKWRTSYTSTVTMSGLSRISSDRLSLVASIVSDAFIEFRDR